MIIVLLLQQHYDHGVLSIKESSLRSCESIFSSVLSGIV